MKKFLLGLALASISMSGMAQDEVPVEKYSVSTNSFWSNWFISAGFQYGASYSAFAHTAGLGLSNSPLKDFRRDLGVSISLGKWFTPGMGLRTKGSIFFAGHNAASIDATGAADAEAGKIKFLNIQEQALFNLSNMLCGYNENRLWNFIPYIGAGWMRNMSDNVNSLGASIGLLNNFRLGKKVSLYLDLSYNWSDYELFASSTNYGSSVANTDRYYGVELGLTYNLGKSNWNKTPDVEALKALSQSQIDALQAQLADEQADRDRWKKMYEDHKCPKSDPVVIKEVTAAPVSVFFNIGKSKIASRKDMQDVKELAEIAKNQNSKIVVTGYADSKTGSASYNQKLSQKRAEVVADELVKMGVSRDNIEVVAAGGVDTLTPISYNRRAVVAVK